MNTRFKLGSLLCSMLISTIIFGQAKETLVYAGRSFTWGMNMGSYDLVVLLRPDGTFCEDLEEPDWQTKITGNYRKIKEGYFLEYIDKTIENDTITFEKDTEGYEFIYYGGAQMVKMEVGNKVPAGYYRFSSASSSGGMGTGMIYVGTQHHEGYNFYDDGTFDRSSSGGVMVSGDNIGGGSSSDSAAKGKYTIKNGLLTLTNDDGTVEKHSFFYQNNGEKEFLVAIDGSIFFYGDEDSTSEDTTASNEVVAQSDDNLAETLKSSGLTFLNAVKQTHGGLEIDKINTVQATFTFSGLRFKLLLDYENKLLRLESLEPSFTYVEQIQDKQGWVYQNGALRELDTARINELRKSFISGVFGLKESVLEQTKILDIRETEDGIILVSVLIDNNTMGYIINKKENSLIGNFILKNGENEITYYSNLKKQNAILMPFTETTESSTGTIEVNYQNIIFNPIFAKKDWVKPM